MNSEFTYWVLPDPQTQEILSQIVHGLAEKYDTPVFEPHMTLLGSFVADLELVRKEAVNLAKKLKGIKLDLGRVEYSTTYFQNVFVRVNASPQLMDAYILARDVFNIDKNKIFMPHISLMYGEHTMLIRDQVAKSVVIDVESCYPKTLVITPSVIDPNKWKHLTEIEL